YTIEDNYCMETGEIALETLLPEEAVWTYVEFDFQVNNQIDSILRLDELGVGQHTVLVINEDFRGCTVDKSFPIQIFDVPLVEVADTFCQVDAPFSLTDLWPDGMYWLDGWAADSIFPDQLTAGTHELDMYLPNVFDTLRIADQELTRADSGLVGANFGQDTIFWQSFRPDSAYFFQSASMRIGVFDTIEMVSELWRGPVGTGTLLLAETRTLIPDPYVSYPELIRAGTLNIPMVPDSLYTLVIRPITFFGSPGSLLGAKKNLYPDGEGYPADSLNPNVDWLFRIFHQKERHCGSNRQHIFEVQAQPNAPLTFLSGPDSVLLGTTTTYTWDGTWADDLLLEIPGATCLNCPPTGDSLIVEWNTVGEQEIRVVATNACGQEEVVKTVWVETATSLNADRLRGGKVFPNPFNSGLTIQLNLSLNGNMHLEFYDLKGSLIETQQQHLFPGANRSYQFSTEHLPQGAYMLQIRIGETLSRHLLTKE
ncbi:MAG: T9SS type A sorting domain-containing protein, partial [Bacteroidota bacterium]